MGNFCAPKDHLPRKCLPLLKSLAHLPDATDVLLFDEVRVTPELMIAPVNLDTDFTANDIEDGDIFIIQEELSTVSAAETLKNPDHPGPSCAHKGQYVPLLQSESAADVLHA